MKNIIICIVNYIKKMTTCTTSEYSNNVVPFGLHLLAASLISLGILFLGIFFLVMWAQEIFFGGSSFWFSIFLSAVIFNLPVRSIRKKGGRFTNRYKPKETDSDEMKKARASGDAEFIDIFHWKYGGGNLKRGFYAFHSGFSFVLFGSRHQAGYSTLQQVIIQDTAQINFSGDGDKLSEDKEETDNEDKKPADKGNKKSADKEATDTSNIRFQVGIDYTLIFKFDWSNPFSIYKDLERTDFVESVKVKLRDACRRAIDSATAGRELGDIMSKKEGLRKFKKDVQKRFTRIYLELLRESPIINNIKIVGNIDIGDVSLPEEILEAMNDAAKIAFVEAGNRNAASGIVRASNGKIPLKEAIKMVQVNQGHRKMDQKVFGLDERTLEALGPILGSILSKMIAN